MNADAPATPAFDEAAHAEREEHDRVPGGRDARVAVVTHSPEDPAEHAEDEHRAEQRDEPRVREPVAPADLVPDFLLERLEARGVRLAVVLDPVAEEREALRPGREHVVDDLGDRSLVLGQLLVLSARELEVGDLLGADAAPRAPAPS